MALNDQILDELKKALNKVQATTATRQSWQEQFDRQPVVTPDHVQAAKALEGFAGSWAAQAAIAPNTDELLTYAQEDGVYTPQLVTSHLGRPGVPETNFPLYARGTNKDDEPAFLGHPISFSIVGPTLRHKTNNWQWTYRVVGTEELLVLDDSFTYDGSTAIVADIEDIFGITAIPDGGLYFVVSQTGHPAAIDPDAAPLTQGGVGDGYVNPASGDPIREKTDPVTGEVLRSARYEIFRINRIDTTINPNDSFVLEKTKRLSDYFDIPTGLPPGDLPLVRAITLFKPYVSRMMAIPSTEGVSKNKVFLTMTPEVSANDDLYPAYGAGTTSDQTWRGGNFTDYDTNLEAPAAAYGGQAKLPVYIPKGQGVGRLSTNRYLSADGLPFEAGVLKVTDYTGTVVAGDVICIHNVSQMNSDYGTMHTVYEGFNPSRGKHYYEVLSVEAGPPPHLRCKALPQVDTNGNIFYGPVVMDATIDLDGIPVAATGAVQIKNVSGAGESYSVTIQNPRTNTTNTYTHVTAAAETPLFIVGSLVALINLGPDPNVVASVNGPFAPDIDTTLVLTATTLGVVGNAIAFSVAGTGSANMFVSGSQLGSSANANLGYGSTGTSAVVPVLGHGIGINEYFLQASYTIHDNVSSLYQGKFDSTKVQANRLANLIDPTWTRDALSKLQSVTQSQVAKAAGRADKAIFDTTVGTKGAVNPGSLLDLGFRMVLYPAKEDLITGEAIPDFDKPITTQNVILDPAINEAQYLYIDYASGAVICSHTPDPTSPLCTIAPNGIVGYPSNNLRRDIVLYAACVPFSRMPDQSSGGLRLMSTQTVPVLTATTTSVSYVEEGVGSQDILGGRVTLPVAGVFNGVNQTLLSQIQNQSVYLTENDVIANGSSLSTALPTIRVLINPVGGEQLVFSLGTSAYQITLTAVLAAPTANEFLIGANAVATAGNISSKINSDLRISQILHATWDGLSANVQVFTRRVGFQVVRSSFFPFTFAEASPFFVLSNTPASLAMTSVGNTRSTLSAASYESLLPQSGWFDVIETETNEPALRFTSAGQIVRRICTFSYSGKELVRDTVANRTRTRLDNVFGGGAVGQDIDLNSTRYSIVLRKADVLPNDPLGNTGTPFQLDTTEGSSARFSKIRFAQGDLNYSGGVLTLDLAGDFVKKRGDTMSGQLVISIDTTLNPSETNKSGLRATGNGTGYGVHATNGVGATAAVYGEADAATNAYGVLGMGAGTGAGVGGMGEAGSSSTGVYGVGANPSGKGVEGLGFGTAEGVKGTGGATSGAGVVGTGGLPDGTGVKGYAGGVGNGNGVEGYGQAAAATSEQEVGVVGVGGRDGDGVYGKCGTTAGKTGVRGVAPALSNNAGVRGEAAGSGNGVEGQADNSGNGVYGKGGTASGAGVYGESGAATGEVGGRFLGDSGGAGVEGTGGAVSGSGVHGIGGGPNGDGVKADGTGAGRGVNATGGLTGAGVITTGARGLVSSSNAIANYPQAQLTAQGSALPLLANRQKGDLWFPSANGVGGEDWNGHLLIYDGTNYLDAYSAISSTHLMYSQTASWKNIGVGAWSQTTANRFVEQQNFPLAASVLIASTGIPLFGLTLITTAVAHGLSVGDYVYIIGALNTNLNNDPPSGNPQPSWIVNTVGGPNDFYVANTLGGAAGAGGSVQKVPPHPMGSSVFVTGAAGANTMVFAYSHHIPKSFHSISTTGTDVVFKFWHSASVQATLTTWTVGVARFPNPNNVGVIGSYEKPVRATLAGLAGSYNTVYTRETRITVADLTAAFGAAQPFEVGDVWVFSLIVTGNVNNADFYGYDAEFTFAEAYYAKY